ncbi:alcohol dehydrogenase catalytic domain-containing protein [Corynebacterium sp. sy039]|uniref:alcohol dehydrogenase catalytic domain-containing protein n=1 Tax=Corynebacterium sp. sy039 TaxID=2599641 RepID=UPI0011B4A3A2|nr:alcohol dehydrogenase catalytic domain-containing protein [Corynebacterium sp. sy039]QDZ42866.1 zinc-binding dehydrogenase [Corynebacterium sp. sy039]
MSVHTSLSEPINALVWMGGLNFENVALAAPQLQPGESLVRITTASICGSDRHTVTGRRKQACPSVLGHEGVGIVEQTRNPLLVPGQRVTFSVTAPCMSCDRCEMGCTAKCRNLLKTGHEPFNGDWSLSGTYASHIVLRAHQPVAVVPDTLEDVPASIASCAGGTVMAALEKVCHHVGSLAGKRLLVVGCGMLGLLAVDVAIQAGAVVTAIDPNPQRCAWAQSLGAMVYTPAEYTANPCSIDVSCEFSGSAQGVDSCISVLDIGGLAVLGGSVATSPDISVNPEWLVRGLRHIVGVHNYEPRHLEQALDFLSRSTIDWESITAGPISLAEVPHAFDPTDALRIIVSV